MKKTLSALAVAAMAFGIMSCNNQPKANDTKETAKPATATAAAGSQQIAYVEIDSIMTQYTYWKEVAKILEAKEKNIQKTLVVCPLYLLSDSWVVYLMNRHCSTVAIDSCGSERCKVASHNIFCRSCKCYFHNLLAILSSLQCQVGNSNVDPTF